MLFVLVLVDGRGGYSLFHSFEGVILLQGGGFGGRGLREFFLCQDFSNPILIPMSLHFTLHCYVPVYKGLYVGIYRGRVF